jgi:hypothetical protein
MDPLSVTGTLVGMISLGIQVMQSLVDYYRAVKGQESNVNDISKSLQRSSEFLKVLCDHVDSRQFVQTNVL